MAAQSTRIDPPRDNKPPRFFIDFVGRAPIVLAPDTPLSAKITASRGDIRNLVVEPNDVTGGWRVFFDLVAPGTDKVDLRGTLNLGERVLSETWVYLWLP
jgi:glucans biosynthesis protein